MNYFVPNCIDVNFRAQDVFDWLNKYVDFELAKYCADEFISQI